MKKNFLIIRRLWDLLKPFHKHFYIQLLLISTLSILDIYWSVLMGKVINSASLKDTNAIIFSVVMIFAWMVVYWSLDFFKDYRHRLRFSRSVYHHLREMTMRSILKLNASQFYEEHSAIKFDVIATGEEKIVTSIEAIILQILPTLTLFIAGAVMLFSYSPFLALLSVTACFVIFFWEGKFNRSVYPAIKQAREKSLEQGKVSRDAISHLPTIKILSVENKFIKNFLSFRETIMRFQLVTDKKKEIHYGLRNYAIELLNFIGIVFALYLFIKGDILLGVIYTVFSINGQLFSKARYLQTAFSNIFYSRVDVERYLELIDKEPLFNENGKQKFVAGDINFENVTFKYPKSEGDVLKGVSFTIKQNTKVAIVGRSGSGKTTITKLLLRMYDWDGGDIVVGGKSLRTLNSHSLRSHVGYVEQHIDLFDSTLRDNILLGVHDRKVSEKELEQIAKSARITEFYHRLGEAKFDTVLGERGIKLSGGERQRVGIARALVKNPDILIFDEATSALDSENEKYIKEAIDEASEGRTTIIIAHRLSTIFDADKIIVMDRGQIVGEGSHVELMVSCPTYRELVEHQELV